MISLKDFIELQSNKYTELDEAYINEYYNEICENAITLHLNESNARYKGQYELSEFLTFELLKKHSKDCEIEFKKDELEKFDNIFFDKITIKYSDNLKDSGGYKKNKTENPNFREISISVNSNENVKYENIFSVISHELKHAWQDYKEIYVDDYIEKIAQSDFYKRVTKNLNKIDDEGLASNIIYRIIDIEKDAFASEFSTEFQIEVYKEKPKSLQDCIELARRSTVYNEVYTYYSICLALDKNDSYLVFSKDELLNQARKLLKKKNLTWEDFNRKYVNQLRKLFGKLCNVVANVYYNYVDEQEKTNEDYLIRPSRKTIIRLQREEIINRV